MSESFDKTNNQGCGKEELKKKYYDKGFQAGSQVKKGKAQLTQLLSRYDTLRKEFNKRIREERLEERKQAEKEFRELIDEWEITYDNGTSFFEKKGFRTNSGEHFVKELKNQIGGKDEKVSSV